MRSQSPYVDEVRAIAATLGFPGIWFLNGSYQWSCTALARDEDGAPWLARTLDWPFPGLGRYRRAGPHARAGRRVHQRHLAGLCRRADRDGAGPLRRLHQPGADAAAEPQPLAAALRSCRQRDRRRCAMRGRSRRISCCARCSRRRASYDDARRMLETTPVARPVIYTLAGCRAERALRHRAHRGWLQHPHRRPRRRQRLAGQHAALGGPHRRQQGVHLLVRGGGANTAAPAAKGWRCGAARSRATASAGSRRRCSIPTRGSRSRCARRAA